MIYCLAAVLLFVIGAWVLTLWTALYHEDGADD